MPRPKEKLAQDILDIVEYFLVNLDLEVEQEDCPQGGCLLIQKILRVGNKALAISESSLLEVSDYGGGMSFIFGPGEIPKVIQALKNQ